ncbi:oxygenase MpaB family protein [Actinoplanes sp. NPDC026619]|uniref:oxygenase MpaB family protein n=1 Tax=Actinoplanes sp. NPDC026619 TaxID=3155798 RepID=UPI0033D98D83
MTGDVGLFGPGSVTWKLHQEPILLLGGLRSLYLQALHPRAVTAVAQNSRYRADPWGRLTRTSAYVGTVVWGTTEEAEAASLRVRRMHARMTAADPRTGERFRIDEPDLLRWVHVAEVESFLSTAVRAGVRLTPDEIDGYYTEQLRAAELMGLDPATVPATADEVSAYYDEMLPTLALSRDGLETALFLTVPSVPESWGGRAFRLGLTLGPTRWAYFGIAATAMALLPPWARRLYGGFGLPTTDLTADLSARGLRFLLSTVLATIPRSLRVAPIREAALARAAEAAVS